MKVTMEFARAQRREKDKKTLRNKGEQFLYIQLRRDFGYSKIYGVSIVEYVESLKKEIAEEIAKESK